ncbi:MAG TPA: universal stress protein [Chloroflexota bacterium]|nr:universal stress protein [Chloroflexota bacterium]
MAGQDRTYRRLLVPLDGSPEAEAALSHAVAQARAFGAPIHLIRVVSPVGGSAPLSVDVPAEAGLSSTLGALASEETDPETLGAAIYLNDIARRLRAEGVEVYAVVREGPVAITILAEAADLPADLIIIATEVPSGLVARLVLGSVADELLRSAPCPVLHLRSAAPLTTTRETNRLRNFADDLAAVGAVTPVPLGLREVPVDRITGSVGRTRELGADFRPLDSRRRNDERFARVRQALARGQGLPPLQLYKLGYDYYVLDGHHRVSAARELGIRELEAEVTEFLSSSNTEQQQVFAERREFERLTGLTHVGATRPGTYPRLLEMIREAATFERHIRGAPDGHPSRERTSPPATAADGAGTGDMPQPREGSTGRARAAPDEAFQEQARHWYYTFFQPLAQQIRAKRLRQSFPGERTADILVRLWDFRTEEARLGHEVSWSMALEHFAAAYSGGQRRGWGFDLRRLFH